MLDLRGVVQRGSGSACVKCNNALPSNSNLGNLAEELVNSFLQGEQ